MFQKFKVNKIILNRINREFLDISSVLLNKKFKDLDEILSKISKKDEKKLFYVLNLSLKIYDLLNPIKNYIEKKTKKKLLLWTYPQVRIDLKKSNTFSAPLHKDQWILEKNGNGYVAWIPINKKGGALKFLSKKIKNLKIKKSTYWGLEIDKKGIETESQKINFGEAVIFDHNKIHESDLNNQRISIQYRFKELKKSIKSRGINQIIDPRIKKYWIKTLNAK
jgi:hypothetical protein